VPAVYTFKHAGAAMREAAQMTFVLKKERDRKSTRLNSSHQI